MEPAPIVSGGRTKPAGERFLYIDAIHVKVRRKHVSSEAFYVVLGLTETMQREVLTITSIPSESARGWEKMLEDLVTGSEPQRKG